MYDRVVVMSYDYYASNSDIAGPVAPMGGFAEKKYLFDIVTTYEDYLKVVPKEKLVMGVPYYGYDWPVENGSEINSPTLPQNDQNGYPEVISYGRAKTFESLKEENCQWEPLAQSRWCYYTDPETEVDHQVWVEDNQSIEAKFNFAKKEDLSGIAIWTLGYDKQYPDLWEMIKKIFSNN
jgi:spore germination protein YaaH